MNDRSIAYFSMEIGLEPGMPTYAGGLGVLAGDIIRSAQELFDASTNPGMVVHDHNPDLLVYHDHSL